MPPMLNPFRSIMDRRRAIAAADALYHVLRETSQMNGGASGVDLPADTEGGVAILHHLLRLHPDVRVVRNAKNMTLVLDRNLRQGTSRELYDHFNHTGTIFGPGGEDK